jgi:hypothetical protein
VASKGFISPLFSDVWQGKELPARFVYVWQRKKLEVSSLKREEEGEKAAEISLADRRGNEASKEREQSAFCQANMGDDSRGWS